MRRGNDTGNDASSAATAEALEAFKAKLAKGKRTPSENPTRLPVRAIKTLPALFQPRGRAGWGSRDHTAKLAASIRGAQEVLGAGGVETPIMVIQAGRNWFCIDGHHRLEALKSELKVGMDATVPVTVFEGSAEDAMLHSARANSRDKHRMTKSEKTGHAWRLYLTGRWEPKALALNCDVSLRTMRTMTKAKGLLGATPDDLEALRQRQWGDVQRQLQGLTDDDEPMELREKLASRIAKQAVALEKVVRDSSPMIVAEALIEMNPEFAREVARLVTQQAADEEARTKEEEDQEELEGPPVGLCPEF